jgi:hypothetical protein
MSGERHANTVTGRAAFVQEEAGKQAMGDKQ